MTVLFSPEMEDYLFDLVEVLYREAYFGFYESAMRYVTELIEEIEANLPQCVAKTAPSHFQKEEGEIIFYSFFSKNYHTTWYIFFSIHPNEKILLVKNILNNHAPEARYLNL